MKIGGTVAFWVKVGLILAVGAVVLYTYNAIKGILPTGETVSNVLTRLKETASEIFPPSVEYDSLPTEQKKAVNEVVKWSTLPFIGPVTGWIAERYYSTHLPYETVPAGSSTDVGVSLPTPTPATTAPAYLQSESTVNEYGYAITQD